MDFGSLGASVAILAMAVIQSRSTLSRTAGCSGGMDARTPGYMEALSGKQPARVARSGHAAFHQVFRSVFRSPSIDNWEEAQKSEQLPFPSEELWEFLRASLVQLHGSW